MSGNFEVLKNLVGKTMWTARRAADLTAFHFGNRVPVRDFYGRESEIGEYALHIQCPWRITDSNSVIVGSGDLYYPADWPPAVDLPDSFDWDAEPNRRDKLLGSLINGEALIVRDVTVATAGSCRIDFDRQISLEIFPNDSLEDEHWRLFSADANGAQVIVSGS